MVIETEDVVDKLATMDTCDLFILWNAYCNSRLCYEDLIYDNDDEFFNDHFSGNPQEAVRAAIYGEYDYTDDYVCFNGAGNLVSFNSECSDKCPFDENELADGIKENSTVREVFKRLC